VRYQKKVLEMLLIRMTLLLLKRRRLLIMGYRSLRRLLERMRHAGRDARKKVRGTRR
jgi:hypothetical protein